MCEVPCQVVYKGKQCIRSPEVQQLRTPTEYMAPVLEPILGIVCISHTYDDVCEVVSACSSKNQDRLLTKPSLDLDIFDALGWKALQLLVLARTGLEDFKSDISMIPKSFFLPLLNN
ncbi:unnamed protein product [Danaus chrysippus]|uniref:(African queen) hypothetical protein n=1 Tax=Danaus chrysippus TaxID=151541 RepID=A0A8J2QNM8_9NEOP|nr:unnamed protein product [Danaus chrysippus]